MGMTMSMITTLPMSVITTHRTCILIAMMIRISTHSRMSASVSIMVPLTLVLLCSIPTCISMLRVMMIIMMSLRMLSILSIMMIAISKLLLRMMLLRSLSLLVIIVRLR